MAGMMTARPLPSWRDPRTLIRLCGLAVPLLAWETASRTGLLHSVFTPPFTRAVARMLELPIASPGDFLITGLEIAAALAATGISGVTIGVILARSETLDALLGGLIWFIYAAPIVAFTTLFIVIFGVGPMVPISLGILSGIVFVIASTRDGVREVSYELIRVGRVFGGGRFTVARKIIVPAAIPMIMAGLRIGVGRVLVGVIVGEYFASGSGLGYLIVKFGNELDMERVYAAVLWIILVSIVLNAVFARIERSFVTWRAI
jgi:ABC-type nitrate/sulfonate/bicarbonate transport system permease component